MTDDPLRGDPRAGDESLPDERPQRRREYSGPASTLGIAAAIVLVVGIALWFLEFRTPESPPAAGQAGLGVVPLPQSSGAAAAAREGRPAPDFRLVTPSGDTLRLSDLRGAYVLLNFWASWCGPCRGETPDLQRLSERTAHTRLRVLGVNQQETAAQAAAFATEFGVSYPIVLDRNGDVSAAYRIGRGLPVSLLLDPSGVVVRIYLGRLQADAIAKLEHDYAS